MDNDLRQRDRNIAKRKRQLADSEKRITELDAIFKRLYEDNISGKLSDERFQKLSVDYEKEEQELKVLASSLRKEVELEESKSADVDRFLSVVERCTDIPELTPCILHEFVEKIIVHALCSHPPPSRREAFRHRHVKAPSLRGLSPLGDWGSYPKYSCISAFFISSSFSRLCCTVCFCWSTCSTKAANLSCSSKGTSIISSS